MSSKFIFVMDIGEFSFELFEIDGEMVTEVNCILLYILYFK